MASMAGAYRVEPLKNHNNKIFIHLTFIRAITFRENQYENDHQEVFIDDHFIPTLRFLVDGLGQ